MSIFNTFSKIPDILYNYKPWNDYTKQILTNHQLWFSYPDEFNDPYDCKPYIKDTKFRIPSDTQLGLPRKDVGVMHMPVSKGEIRISYNLQKQIGNTLLSSYMIYCFSKRNDNILLWSHYAEYHKGICLVFSPIEDSTCFNHGYDIYYSNKRHEYTLLENLEERNPLNTKYAGWQYEDEFRIIKTPTEVQHNNGSNLYSFKPEALSEIILGAKASEQTYSEVTQMCEEHQLKHVKFSKMQLADEELYKLIKVPLK